MKEHNNPTIYENEYQKLIPRNMNSQQYKTILCVPLIIAIFLKFNKKLFLFR